MAEIITTKDGSKTIFVPELNETYHSVHGALQEALHVFIKNGIELVNKEQIHVLEVGFGTGLNAILACEYAAQQQKNIHYIGLEKYPLSEEITKELGYDLFLSEEGKRNFSIMHQTEWEQATQLHPFFQFEKKHTSIHTFETSHLFDLIFFDAFAPEKQPDMWTETVFEQLFSMLNPSGIITTYCAKGKFKRTLKAVGFEVKASLGPPGKREMTIGIKPNR